MGAYKTIEKDGFRLNIYYDESPLNPIEDNDISTIAYKSSRYILGNEEFENTLDFLADKLDLDEDSIERLYNKLDSSQVLQELESRFLKKYIAIPVYTYIHSGVTVSTNPFSCRFDSGQSGWIYADKETVRKVYEVKRITKKIKASVLQTLEAQIEEFDCYLSGDIYGYTLESIRECECCEQEVIKELDSCWGFYKDDFSNNGMKENIPKEAQHLLDEA